MRIFLAGGLGPIGRRAAPLLVGAGHTVVAAVPDARASTTLAASGAEPLVVDLFDRDEVMRALHGADTAINVTAQIPRPSRAWRTAAWVENDRLNREASMNLVDAAMAAGANRFIQESTVLVYADAGDQWIAEDADTAVTRVTQSAIFCEQQAERFTGAGRVGVVLRFGAVYGPGVDATQSALRAARRGFGATVGDNRGYVSMIHADDAAAAVVAALDLPAGCYNVVEDDPGTKLAQMDAIAGALGIRRLNSSGPAIAALGGARTRAMGRSLRVSNEKLRGESAWRPVFADQQQGWLAVAASETPQGVR